MNKNNHWVSAHISHLELEAINQKIKDMEKHTSAEIVTVVANRSSTVHHTQLSLFLLANTTLFFLYFLLNEMFLLNEYELIFLISSLLFSALFSLVMSPLMWVQRIMTPAIDRNNQVLCRSELEFYKQRIHMTRSKTGLLIYLSIMEKKAVVLADKSIAKKFPTNTWSEVVDTIITGIKNKNISEGILNGLSDCQERLTEHFPIEDNDINELPNEVVLLTL